MSDQVLKLVYAEAGEIGVLNEKHVVLYSRDRKIVKRLPSADNRRTLFVTKDMQLVTAPGRILSASGASDSTIRHYVEDYTRLFSQRSGVFLAMRGVTLLSGKREFHLEEYGRLSSVGLSGDASLLAYWNNQKELDPIVLFVRDQEGRYNKLKSLLPTLKGFGSIEILPRFNDLVILSEKYILFLGNVIADSAEKDSELRQKVPFQEEFPLDYHRNARAYLIAMRISDGEAKAIASFPVSGSGERGQGENVLVPSADSSYTYLRGQRGVARISTAFVETCLNKT